MRTLRTIFAAAVIAAATLAVTYVTTGRVRAAEAGPVAAATAVLHVEGMTCPSCKVAVRTALSRLDGVKDVRVDVAAKSATVLFDPAKQTPEALADEVNRLGYRASPSARNMPEGTP